jgi:ubiquinone/menaquinone biosynthesis C-methylase UbiE
MPTSVRELYEVWAGDSELGEELSRSLEPRGVDWLFDAFRALGPKPGDVVLDAGARDAKHAIRLVSELGVRAVALDPLPLHCELARERIAEAGLSDEIDVVEGALEELPFDDASFDWIWCRDVLVHVDVEPGLKEAARVLRPGGALLAYVTLATESLEPRERAGLTAALALRTLDADALEAAAGETDLVLRSIDRLGSEWREAMIEEASWRVADDLLQLARLRRREAELVERHGAATVDAAAGGLMWGVYQLLGKLCPTVYVWERRA